MPNRNDHTCSLRARIQHYVLNWILISRYQIAHLGVPKKTATRSMLAVENLLKRINLIT